MPHFERGVYEPNEDMRVFDGTEDDDDVEGSRLPLLIVLALLVLAMFAGVVWLAYTQGVARGRTETPVLTAQNGPARIAPQNPGGAEQPYKGFKIYEQPAPPDDAVDSTTAAPAPAAAPPAAAPPPPAPKPVAVAATPKPAPVTAAKVAPAPAAKAAPPPVAVAKVVAPPAPVKVAAASPVVAAAPLAPAKAAPVTASLVPAASATGAPRSLALTPKPVAAPAAPAASAASVSAPAGGAYVLQIGAFKSQAEAATAWQAYKAEHAALLSGTSDDIQQADLADKGVWYRLRLTGFPSKDVASALCDRLKADGGGCFLGK